MEIPAANVGMIEAGIEALNELRKNGMASKDNGDANLVYGIYEAMRAERLRQLSCTNDLVP